MAKINEVVRGLLRYGHYITEKRTTAKKFYSHTIPQR